MKRHTIQDIVEYILANRSNKAYKDWTPTQIVDAIAVGVEDNSMLVSITPNGEISGVVTCSKIRSAKVLYVNGLVTTAKGVMKTFLQRFRELYPDWSLEATRHGKYVKYPTNRLVKLATL